MLERSIARILIKKRLTLAVAESCTGGLISHTLTNIPGSSGYFVGGIIAYSDAIKERIVGVPAEIIKEHGAVSKETALAMATGVKHRTGAHVGIGITGIAGPGGAAPLKPVGTVFIAVSIGHHLYFKKFRFSGNRLKIKQRAKDAALALLATCLA